MSDLSRIWTHPTPARELAWQAHCTAVHRLQARMPLLDVEADRGLVLPTRRSVFAKVLGHFGYALVPVSRLESLAVATKAFIEDFAKGDRRV